MDNIIQAAHLAAWLITTKKQKRQLAVLIASRKFGVPFSKRSEVSKQATQIIKHPDNQMELL